MQLWNILVYNYKWNLKVGEDKGTRIKVHQTSSSDNLHLYLQKKPQKQQTQTPQKTKTHAQKNPNNREPHQFGRVKPGTRWRYAEKKQRREETEVGMTSASFLVLDIILLWNLVISQDSPWSSRLSLSNKDNLATAVNYDVQSTLTSVDRRITTITTFIE